VHVIVKKETQVRWVGTKNIGNEKDGKLGIWRASDIGLKASKFLDCPCSTG